MKLYRLPALAGALLAGSIALLAGLPGVAAAPESPAVPAMAKPAASATTSDTARLYQTHCASCHGERRLGGIGPALLPENLERLKPAEARKVIDGGRAATQMPGFGSAVSGPLTPAEIEALAAYVYAPVTPRPQWTDADIKASREVHADAAKLPNRPKFTADPKNLFLVVETGDHHVTVLDGDRLEPITRFKSRYALHGGPKYTSDGRFVFFASRDGWITKYDLWNLMPVVEIRAGLNTRNVAVSGDGRWVAVGNYLPHSLVLLDADLNLVAQLPVTAAKAAEGAKSGPASSRVSAVYDATPRQSFIVALKDLPEIWEIRYDRPLAAGKAAPTPRRIVLDDVLDDFFFDPDYRHVLGAARPGSDGSGRGQVVNLEAGRKVADLKLPGLPHLGSGIAWPRDGKVVLATPNLQRGLVTVLDLDGFGTIADIPTPGPGFFLRSHENTRYAWTDSMMNPQRKDTLTVIDKATLQVAAELRPEPGKTLAHIEFTRDGRHALASLWERRTNGGALIVFDAETLKEVKRIPMDKPVGKYNVYNKTTKSWGTSH